GADGDAGPVLLFAAWKNPGAGQLAGPRLQSPLRAVAQAGAALSLGSGRGGGVAFWVVGMGFRPAGGGVHSAARRRHGAIAVRPQQQRWPGSFGGFATAVREA